jgi:hypothetical protein
MALKSIFARRLCGAYPAGGGLPPPNAAAPPARPQLPRAATSPSTRRTGRCTRRRKDSRRRAPASRWSLPRPLFIIGEPRADQRLLARGLDVERADFPIALCGGKFQQTVVVSDKRDQIVVQKFSERQTRPEFFAFLDRAFEPATSQPLDRFRAGTWRCQFLRVDGRRGGRLPAQDFGIFALQHLGRLRASRC